MARNEREALGLIADGHIDVTILDANLNGRSAAPIAGKLRGMSVPFVAVSDYSRLSPPIPPRSRASNCSSSALNASMVSALYMICRMPTRSARSSSSART